MKALVDADILRYELGFAAETGWRAIKEDPEAIPPFDYVEDMLLKRLEYIKTETKADSMELYLTSGPTFREQIATVKPYKGTRPDKKPWHYNNLSVYIRDVLPTKVIRHIEADDALAVEHTNSWEPTVLCSRDKDLKQVPGMFYSWELGNQAAFGPVEISKVGSLSLSDDNKKLTGTGFAFFCAQVLMGDPVDNIPGLPGCGPVATYEKLSFANDLKEEGGYLTEALCEAYIDKYGDESEERLLEQGRLCWMTRRLHGDGSPVLYEIGMTE